MHDDGNDVSEDLVFCQDQVGVFCSHYEEHLSARSEGRVVCGVNDGRVIYNNSANELCYKVEYLHVKKEE